MSQDGRLVAIFVRKNKPILNIFEVLKGSFGEELRNWLNIWVARAPTLGTSPHQKLKWPTDGHLCWQNSADFANVSQVFEEIFGSSWSIALIFDIEMHINMGTPKCSLHWCK